MTIKFVLQRYIWIVLLASVVSCGKEIAALPTETPVPTAVSPTLIPTSTIIPVTVTPSPLPTEPVVPVITPDPIQVERWKEYQAELAKLVLAQHSSQEIPFDETTLCEWDILGRSDQEMYVWAICSTPGSGSTKPAVIHLELDGSIQKVEVPFHGSAWESTIQKLFPANVQEKIDAYFYSSSSNSGRAEELRKHLLYRQTNPEVPPLIVLSATPTIFQVERWMEYEDALGKAIFKEAPIVLCEWEIVGQTGQEVYVWTVCTNMDGTGSVPAVIYLNPDGTVQSVSYTGSIPGLTFTEALGKLFPADIQEKLRHIDIGDMSAHLEKRRTHPVEPPLIVLSATLTP